MPLNKEIKPNQIKPNHYLGYLKPYNYVQIIHITSEYLKPHSCVQIICTR